MKKYLRLILFILPYSLFSQALKVYDLRIEQLINPLGLDMIQPRLSWKLQSDAFNTMQTAYEITVATVPDFNPKNMVWKIKTATDQSINIKYTGKALMSNTRYYWKVTVWDNHGNTAMSSTPVFWHTGLLNKNEWVAKWISSTSIKADSIHYQSPVFKKEFSVNKPMKSATLFISSRGLYEAEINGVKVGNDYLTPGWTAYNSRIQYQVYDVTNMIKKEANAIGVTLGKGWFSGEVGWINASNLYGKDLALISQLIITYTDGSTWIIPTDGTWKSSNGPILNSEIYH
ncbi:MAG: alpha-L-rhamnosidase N-terminal domain-containing protein, partial [Saprospiraceae bacterium]